MSTTLYTVKAAHLIADAERIEREAEQSLRAWILLGETEKFGERMAIARALRNAAATKSIYTRREILRGAGFTIKAAREVVADIDAARAAAQAEADAAEDAREAAMHREYQEGWDAFYERSGAVCPYAGGVCGEAWDAGYMAAARNARENRAMGL